MRTRRLVISTPEGERALLFVGRLTAGRGPDCDISIADIKISRRHAEFDASGVVPRVIDLGSRNGILVNGRRVGSADLAPGDVVTLGDAVVRLEETASVPPDVDWAARTEDRTVLLPPVTPGGATHAPAAVAAPATRDTVVDRTTRLPRPPFAAPAAGSTEPAWVEVTPTLSVRAISDHAPVTGTQHWATSVGRHLLDVVDDSRLRKRVAEGLGALGLQVDAVAVVPLDDGSELVLRRVEDGHVRVTFGRP